MLWLKEEDDDGEIRTNSLGTISYMPPEVLCPGVVVVVVVAVVVVAVFVAAVVVVVVVVGVGVAVAVAVGVGVRVVCVVVGRKTQLKPSLVE